MPCSIWFLKRIYSPFLHLQKEQDILSTMLTSEKTSQTWSLFLADCLPSSSLHRTLGSRIFSEYSVKQNAVYHIPYSSSFINKIACFLFKVCASHNNVQQRSSSCAELIVCSWIQNNHHYAGENVQLCSCETSCRVSNHLLLKYFLVNIIYKAFYPHVVFLPAQG